MRNALILIVMAIVVVIAALLYMGNTEAEYCGLTPETACDTLEDLQESTLKVDQADTSSMPVHIRAEMSTEHCLQACSNVPVQRTQDVSQIQPAGL